MNITDLMVSGVFLAREQPNTEPEISTFPDYFTNLLSLDDPKSRLEGALGLLEGLSENFEKDEFSDLPNQLETGELELLLNDSVTPKVNEKSVTLLRNKDEISETVFLHSANRKTQSFEYPSQNEPALSINPSLNATSLRVKSRSVGLEDAVTERDNIGPLPQLTKQLQMPSAQISTQAPHLWSVDGSKQIIGKEPLQPANKFANSIAPLPENIQPNKIDPSTTHHSSIPESHAQRKTKSQSPNFSPHSGLNKKDADSSNSIALRSSIDPFAPMTPQPNSKIANVAPYQTEKDAGLEPLKKGTKSLKLSLESSLTLASPPPESLVSKAELIETKGIRKPPIEFKNRDTQNSFIPTLSLPHPVTSQRQKPLDILVQSSQSEMTLNASEKIENQGPRLTHDQAAAGPTLSNQLTLKSNSIGLSQDYTDPSSKREPPSAASHTDTKTILHHDKSIISNQFEGNFLNRSNKNAIFNPSFPVNTVEQGDPEITLIPQPDASKPPLQPVLGFEKIHNPIMQQISPKLIDQLVNKGDGKIEIMLSPKDLGKVEFSFQSHDKSGLSIVILAERDETAALVRRHMDVLTKEFERLGYCNIDFTCDGQSDRQKSKSSPSKERDDIDTANRQQSQAESRSITAHEYTASTAVDIRL